MKAKGLLVAAFLAILALHPLSPSVYGGMAGEPAAQIEASRVAGIPEASPAADSTLIASALSATSVMFIENVGQFDERARFLMRGGDRTIWLAEDAIWVTVVEQPDKETRGQGDWEKFSLSPPLPLTLSPPSPPHLVSPSPRRAVHLKLSFPGANPHPRLEPFNRLDTVVSYFIGDDPAKWRPSVPVWGGVRYVDIYPGVDLELTGEGGRLTWRWVTPTPAPPEEGRVRLRVEGAEDVELLPGGEGLLLTTEVGGFTLPLFAVEGASAGRAGVRRIHAHAFEITSPWLPPQCRGRAEEGVSATTGQRSSDLLYATFLGGSENEGGWAITVDSSGCSYVAGTTWSSNFPTTPGAFDTGFNGDYDAFVAKLRADGSGLAYAIFLGGSGSDEGYAIAVDGSGCSYVTGSTYSSDFPTTPGAFDRSYNGRADAFVAKLKADGSGLVYATFLGGSGYDWGSAIAVDGSGRTYVTGVARSSDFPTTPGAFDTGFNGDSDAFVAKLKTDGSGLAYATFLGGSDYDGGFGIAVDGSESAYVTGGTWSSDFPTTPAAFDRSRNGDGDAFVAKLRADGSGLAYATFLGGSGFDRSWGIAVDGLGSAYVTGRTSSSDFPTTPAALDTGFNGNYDAFVAKLRADGSGLAYATFLGGSESEGGWAIAVDGSGCSYVTGVTRSPGFPTTPGAFDRSHNGSDDAFVARLKADGSGLAYATFLGGRDGEEGWAIAVDGSGSAYVTGVTYSSDFPTTPGAFDMGFNGGYRDAFVAKLAMGDVARLSYVGPLYLPANGFMVDEVDGLITTGDHVRLRLPFRNESNRIIADASVQACGPSQTDGRSGVYIYSGSWLDCWQTIPLTPSTLEPGQTGIADFWIYVTNPDPQHRNSLTGDTWIRVATSSGEWTVRISLSPVAFQIPGNDELKRGSCLHNPDNFEIKKYAQYAAGAVGMRTPPTNNGDPDTPEQAIRNLVNRVKAEFHYRDRWETRQQDIVLLSTRHGYIGVCRDYADLTTGLVRSLGIPGRYTDATFIRSVRPGADEAVGHAWIEAYLGAGGWRQADSTFGTALDEGIYEALGYRVQEVWADRHPLSSASIFVNRQYQCIPPCYAVPPDCPACLHESNARQPPGPPDLSCVEDVTARYRRTDMRSLGLTADEGLMVRIQAPILVTRTVPFTVETGIVNSTTGTLSPITATVAISEYVNSRVPLFQVDPPYRTVSSLGPGAGITVTWTVTPLFPGNAIPLRVMAKSGNYLDVAEQPLVVKEPDALPPLTLEGLCGPGTAGPGRPITITAYVLSEVLRPLMDAYTVVTATVYATPTLGYSKTLSLMPAAGGLFRRTLILPENAPTGTYRVDFAATRLGYASAYRTLAFYVAPSLTMTLMVVPTVLTEMDVLTITAQVYKRGMALKEAGVWAEIRAPNGQVILPLVNDNGIYTASLRLVNLAPNLRGTVGGGEWRITVMADYYGGNSAVTRQVTVLHRLYLPLVLRNR